MRLSCVRPRRIEFTTENNKRILRPRTNIAPDTNYQLNPCFVSNLILPNPKFYCINNKFYDHGAARAQKAREQKIIWRLLKWHSTPSPAPVPPAVRLELRADVIKNGAELRLRGPLSWPLRMGKWYKWRGGAMKWSRGSHADPIPPRSHHRRSMQHLSSLQNLTVSNDVKSICANSEIFTNKREKRKTRLSWKVPATNCKTRAKLSTDFDSQKVKWQINHLSIYLIVSHSVSYLYLSLVIRDHLNLISTYRYR